MSYFLPHENVIVSRTALRQSKIGAVAYTQLAFQVLNLTHTNILYGQYHDGYEPTKLCWSHNILGELGQYHGCWCSNSLHQQVIKSDGIDFVK